MCTSQWQSTEINATKTKKKMEWNGIYMLAHTHTHSYAYAAYTQRDEDQRKDIQPVFWTKTSGKNKREKKKRSRLRSSDANIFRPFFFVSRYLFLVAFLFACMQHIGFLFLLKSMIACC